MNPIPPFWFKQRQCKLEPAGDDGKTFRVTAPNFGEAYLSVGPASPGGWRGSLRLQPGGPELAAADAASAQEAWGRTFELLRTRVLI